MSIENDLYVRIGGVLYNEAPEKAKVILLNAELSPENDHAKLLFDYVDNEGNKDWFSPENPQTDSELMDCLIQLRNYYVENDLTNGRPAWRSCEVKLNVENMKLSIDFQYDELAS
ncbi:hypothetical protein [Yersinia aldovae]|uniref:Protein of uncharacterized function, DUF600 n=1 Tax=Yersinia aldovae TaxID=29483 RepID=A0A0T9U2Q3_YERAL|nr:hypothetical protein [Yersinia aldovae]EEP95360.1 hypothetical protein yaldo0001_28310 [Yersinia aldovae ATCC 35236]CNJ74408.1 Protein of uncharacterised function%2C DUF600 [Yersinia aldovae]CNK70619.1 Protein of uncharacterised function%2C DUF600 [Yersinia aldovae]CNL16257.1 Protein of uncharacterised function%2C DUF600 [Yersinia aldovae]